jgi:hypothetical protein
MSAPRFPVTIDAEGRLCPLNPERTKRLRGRERWASLHEKPSLVKRSQKADNYLWGVVYGTIAKETGGDPDSIHYGLKRKAVKTGILEPCYWMCGDQLMEDEPTTVVDTDTFWGYVNWIRHESEHGLLLGTAEHPIPLHIPEPNEGKYKPTAHGCRHAPLAGKVPRPRHALVCPDCGAEQAHTQEEGAA